MICRRVVTIGMKARYQSEAWKHNLVIGTLLVREEGSDAVGQRCENTAGWSMARMQRR